MNTIELRESIIQKVRHTDDGQLLEYLNQLLNNNDKQETYELSDFEKSIIAESQADYLAGKTITNKEVISRNEEWLRE